MSPFTVFALFVQACLIQSVMSQCGNRQSIGNYGFSGQNSAMSNAGSSLNAVSANSCGSYGGQGTGQVGVAGDIGVAGNTMVVGAVPVLGAVDFCGTVPASGSVSISGQCGCGCSSN